MVDTLLEPTTLRLAAALMIVGTPLAAMLWWYRESEARRRRRRFRGLCAMLAGAGPLLALLWLMQSALLAVLGLDSFPALLLSLLLFGGVGLGVGYLLRRIFEMDAREAGQSRGDIENNLTGEDRP